MNKVETSALSDLVGRTLRIDKFSNKAHEITVAFDVKTGDTFIISHSPVAHPLVGSGSRVIQDI